MYKKLKKIVLIREINGKKERETQYSFVPHSAACYYMLRDPTIVSVEIYA